MQELFGLQLRSLNTKHDMLTGDWISATATKDWTVLIGKANISSLSL